MNRDLKIPRSVAIIMDGNGRWAQQRGLERVEGHIAGVESVRRAIQSSVKWGVECLTIYAFSTENWGRPDAEVEALMELFAKCIVNELPELLEKGVRLRFIGDTSRLKPELQKLIAEAEAKSEECSKLLLQIGFNYSSRDEIRRATKEIAEMVKLGDIEPNNISEELISNLLDTHSAPDPDLIIRTSGELRLSNFLMWQAAYAELYFPDVLWPEFDEAEFEKAIKIYTKRDRRFGLVINEEE